MMTGSTFSAHLARAPLYGLGLALALGAAPAWADGQYRVDDAAMIERDQCEVNIWHSNVRGGGNTSFGELACRMEWPLEAGVVVGRERDGSHRDTLVELFAKTAFVDIEQDGYGVALQVAGEYSDDSRRVELYEVKLPMTAELADGGLMLHSNIGLERDRRAEERNAVTWGLGSEMKLARNVWMVAEVSGDDREAGDPFVQAGPRLGLWDGRLQLDLSYGRETSGEKEEIWSVGLTLSTAAF